MLYFMQENVTFGVTVYENRSVPSVGPSGVLTYISKSMVYPICYIELHIRMLWCVTSDK